MAADKKGLTVDEFARLKKCSVSPIRRAIKHGKLKVGYEPMVRGNGTHFDRMLIIQNKAAREWRTERPCEKHKGIMEFVAKM